MGQLWIDKRLCSYFLKALWLGVCENSFRSLTVTNFGELIWKALHIETWCHLVISNKFLRVCCWVYCGSVGSLLGVFQESVRNLSGVCQNQIWRADLDSSPNWDLLSSPTHFLESAVGFDLSLSEVCWVPMMSLSGVCQESDSNQIWRADLDSSPNMESWFGQLSKLRTVVISNKFLRVCCWV